MPKTIIHTAAAPQVIGPYSQAVQVGQTVYLSGQIPLDPQTMALVGETLVQQAEQVFKNIQMVCKAAGADMDQIVKLTIYLIDLADFAKVNEIMQNYFTLPYPARTTVQVSALPKAAQIEVDAILVLS